MKKRPRILIANRGEIAVRITRAIRDLGYESVCVYTPADSLSLPVRLADQVYPLAENSSYLDMDAIITAVNATQSDFVHPGYGFLSENPVFRKKLEDSKINFIGPKAEAMQLMGDKIQAKKLMESLDVPVVPGWTKPIESLEELERIVLKIGLPCLLKAAAGGGGRGQRPIHQMSDLASAYTACKREAETFFKDGTLFCEKLLLNPRHIEFQILCDSHGKGVHLFERDCTVQRRNQKLFEEAPSSFLSESQRSRFGSLAVKAALAAGYEGAGTIEFIAEDPGHLYFMEMNTRIQVEHPVTELITQKDLIVEQIQIALGHSLSFTQEAIKLNGWAMEARINAENPVSGFTPSLGRINRLTWPSGPGIRIDSHLEVGSEISPHYDSMVAKLIVYGKDREEARKRMLRALGEVDIQGVHTTAFFHQRLCHHPKFIQSDFTTRFVQDFQAELTQPKDSDPMLVLAMWNFQWRHVVVLGKDYWKQTPTPNSFEIRSQDRSLTFHYLPELHCLQYRSGQGVFTLNCSDIQSFDTSDGGVPSWRLEGNLPGPEAFVLEVAMALPIAKTALVDSAKKPVKISAPMAGKVLEVFVQLGDTVVAGQKLITLEAMKMENPVICQVDGEVHQVLIEAGSLVQAGQLLATIKKV